MNIETYELGMADAVEKSHHCDSNNCDIAAALRAGFPLVAAHLLRGATECAEVEDFIKINGEIPLQNGWPVEWNQWEKWFKDNTIRCEKCNFFIFTDTEDSSIRGNCGNCGNGYE